MASPFDPYIPLLEYLGVWLLIFVIGFFLKADKHGIVVKPYYLMLKTGVFNSWMEKLGSRFRKAWLTYYDIGAAMGLGLLVFVIYSFILNLLNLAHHASQAGPTLLIIPLPGLTIGWDIFPYILISIAVLLIPHEVGHGIASVLDKVPLKSSGVFLAIFLPGGFVEIDEENLKTRRARTKLRVFAAGSYTNVVTWFIVFLLITNFATSISPFYSSNSNGVLITGLVNGGAAQTNNIPSGSVITRINTTYVSSVGDLRNVLSPLSPGHHLILTMINSQTYNIVTQPASDNASRATIGIFTFNYYAPRASFLPVAGPFYYYNTLSWMSLILLGVALVNMLPMVPFDGDRYFDTILTRVGLKPRGLISVRTARIVASLVSLSLLLGNLVLSYIQFGTIFPK
jgi:membrane-associated protease RseP (regulator of RpoE activity)